MALSNQSVAAGLTPLQGLPDRPSALLHLSVLLHLPKFVFGLFVGRSACWDEGAARLRDRLAKELLTQSKTNVSALELKRHLGLCYRSAWLLKHKILEGMRLAGADRLLTGRVEIDDA